MFKADQKINAVVQGASRGIGLAMVEALLALPACQSLVATCRHPEQCESLQQLANGDPRLELQSLDLTDDASISQFAATVAQHNRSINLLINVAGILHGEQPDGVAFGPEKRLASLERYNALLLYEVNALGPALVTRALQRQLEKSSRCYVASLSARVGSIGDNRMGGWHSYRASKAAQNMLTKTMAIEFQRSHPELICFGFHPGTTDTALSKPFQANVPPEKLFSPAFVAERFLSVMAALQTEDTGKVFDWAGEIVPP